MRGSLKAIAGILLVGFMAVVGACSGQNQPDYDARVKDQLKTANLDSEVNADWDNDEKTLRLTGEVNGPADKARAEELAKQVVGTAGKVANEIKIEGEDYGRMDDQIEEQLNKMFEDRTEWDFDARGVSFDSKQGVVTIDGNVESTATKDRISQLTRAVNGVKDVVNNLEIDPTRKVDR